MLTAVEMIGYAMVLWITLWHMWEYTIEQFDILDAVVKDDHHVMTYTKPMSKYAADSSHSLPPHHPPL